MKNLITATVAALAILVSLPASAKEREGIYVAQDLGILCEATMRVAAADAGQPYQPKGESDDMMNMGCVYYLAAVLDVSSEALDPRFSAVYSIGGKRVRIHLVEDTAFEDAIKAFLKYLAAHPERAVQEEKADVIIIKALLDSKLASAIPAAPKPAAAAARAKGDAKK
jgi:hypothetical protein